MTGFPYTVLQVVPRLGSGGAERTTLEIARAIVAAGGRALVASYGGRLADDIVRAGGEIMEMPVHRKDPFSIVASARAIEQLLRREEVSLVHARSRAPAWSALLAARRTGIPFVTTFHGIHPADLPLKRWYNSVLVKGDAVIANSRFTGERILADYVLPPGRLKIIHRGADIRHFSPENVDSDRLKNIDRQFGASRIEGAVRFLLPARLTQWKGQSLAVEAVSLLNSKVNAGKAADLRLVLCGGAQGDGQFETALRAEINKRGVRDMVQLVGECADMPAAYAWADAVIAPSLRPEPFGRVAVEAGAMAKPLAAADHGGFTETVVHGETGLLVEPGDAKALAGAIERLSNDAELRDRMGQAGQARVRAIYSSDAMCDATLSVYKELLGRGV